MKMKQLVKILQLTALAAGTAALVTGCGSTANYAQADKTGQGITDYRTAVVGVKKSADSTLKSLDQIETQATTNPRNPYEQYVKDVAALDAAMIKARGRAQAMREEGDAYFSRWEAQSSQVKNDEVKKLAEQRKTELRDSFDRLKKLSDPVNAKFDPWISNLKDLQNYLGNDLTVNGVTAARKLFADAKADGVKVEGTLDELLAELNRISAEMVPAHVPEKQEKPASKPLSSASAK